MVQFYPSIPAFVIPWIQQQKIFFVATAPLSSSGHVNLSPKGFENTFHIVDESTVWYEDLSGSGVETIAHLRENGRMTIMFCAFEGPPRIVRLWGEGRVYEFDTPEYNGLIPLEKRQPGSRSVIMQDVKKVSTSCGYSIPFYTFKSHRMKLHDFFSKREAKDIKVEITSSSSSSSGSCSAGGPPLPEGGLKTYWKEKNQKSIDGLPGLLSAFNSTTTFFPIEVDEEMIVDESVQVSADCATNAVPNEKNPNSFGSNQSSPFSGLMAVLTWLDTKLLVGFVFGWLICFMYMHHEEVGSPWLKTSGVVTKLWKNY